MTTDGTEQARSQWWLLSHLCYQVLMRFWRQWIYLDKDWNGFETGGWSYMSHSQQMAMAKQSFSRNRSLNNKLVVCLQWLLWQCLCCFMFYNWFKQGVVLRMALRHLYSILLNCILPQWTRIRFIMTPMTQLWWLFLNDCTTTLKGS